MGTETAAATTATLLEQAASARRRGDQGEAAGALQRALGQRPPPSLRSRVLHELGLAQLARLDTDGFERLHEAIACEADPRARGAITLELVQPLAVLWRAPEAVAALRRALEALGEADPQLAIKLTGELIAIAAADLKTLPLVAELAATDAGRLAMESEPAPLGLRAAATIAGAGGEAMAVELAERALADGRALACESVNAICLATLALIWADRLERPREIWSRVLADAEQEGSELIAGLARCYLSYIALRAGRVADAAELGGSALLAVRARGVEPKAFPVAPLAEALLECRRPKEAAQALAQADELVGASTHLQATLLQYARGRVRVASGALDAGVEDLLVAGRRAEAGGLASSMVIAWRTEAAAALLQLGEDKEAAALADAALDDARSAGSPPRAIGQALRAVALCAGKVPDTRRLSEAVNVLEDSPARLELASALLDLGRAQRATGVAAAARETLRRALDESHRLGAARLENLAREELLVAGGRPRRPQLSGPASLTPAQRRVAEMAAEGLSNRQIAEQLVVTIRTVEVHLNRSFRKLDIESREQLPRALRTPPA